MFVKPKTEKTIVRDPATGLPIPAEGTQVPEHDSYWLRRLQDGDVVQIEPQADAPAKAKNKEAN